jgi:hypothetical protein
MANGFIVIYTVLLGEAMNNPSCCELWYYDKRIL